MASTTVFGRWWVLRGDEWFSAVREDLGETGGVEAVAICIQYLSRADMGPN